MLAVVVLGRDLCNLADERRLGLRREHLGLALRPALLVDLLLGLDRWVAVELGSAKRRVADPV